MEIREYQRWLEEWDRARGWDRVSPSHTLIHALEELGEVARLILQWEGYKNADSLEHLRADPRTPYASGGFGSAAHLTVALFLARTGTQAEHIPFRGAPDIVHNVRAGNVVFGMPQTQVALPLIRAGQLRALAVTTARRAHGGGIRAGNTRRVKSQ